jgi:dCTP deaminase
MILNGSEIISGYEEGRIHIDPYNPENVGPNSYDITLGSELLKVVPNAKQQGENYQRVVKDVSYIEPTERQFIHPQIMDEAGLIIYPGNLYLASTVEKIGSDYYVPMLEGRSSIGRMGLFIHVTAGFGDIGFKSQWTLELMTIYPIRIFPGMRIGQVFFHTCSSQKMMYQGRYQDQDGPQESLFWRKK